MPKAIEVKVGDEFGLWTVIGEPYAQPRPPGQTYRMVLCRCKCGTEKPMQIRYLGKKPYFSCGCWRNQNNQTNTKTHGESKTRLYKIWCGIKTRCNTPSATRYERYGEIGIQVCQEWADSYEAFRDWSIANGYEDDLTIERKQVQGIYEPSNCEWIPAEKQNRNKNNTIRLTAFGEEKPLLDWIEDPRCLVKNYRTIATRLKLGLSHELAMTTPVGSFRRWKKRPQ